MASRKPRSTFSGRVTLAEIAARVGTSAITVSRAINEPQRVSEELRTQIEQAIEELGYLPNRAARSLASARTDSVAVLIPSLSNTVFTDVLAGVQDVLTGAGYRTLLGDTRYSPVEEESLLRAFLEHAPDGVLVTGYDQTPATRALLRNSRIPVVHMMELGDPGGYAVGLRQFEAGKAITTHLIDRGYRKLGFLGAQLDPRVMERLDGYRHAIGCAGAGVESVEILDPTPSSIGMGVALLDRLLAEAPDCEAVFCCNDDLALGVLFECRRRRIPVPEKLAVAGFNDLAASAWSSPSLTTIATPRYEIGREAASMLLALMKGETPEPTRRDLGFTLMAREST